LGDRLSDRLGDGLDGRWRWSGGFGDRSSDGLGDRLDDGLVRDWVGVWDMMKDWVKGMLVMLGDRGNGG
jgi:hypothetical protein